MKIINNHQQRMTKLLDFSIFPFSCANPDPKSRYSWPVAIIRDFPANSNFTDARPLKWATLRYHRGFTEANGTYGRA